METISFTLPIKTVSEINSTEHWRIKHKRHKIQQFFVRRYFVQNKIKVDLPCTITLTRLSPRFLDDDNLPTSMKYFRDQISEEITGKGGYYITRKKLVKAIKGHADNDRRMTWVYAQEKAKTQAVRIEISFT